MTVWVHLEMRLTAGAEAKAIADGAMPGRQYFVFSAQYFLWQIRLNEKVVQTNKAINYHRLAMLDKAVTKPDNRMT